MTKIEKEIEKIEVDYVFCIPGEKFSANFLYCWTETIQYLIKNNISFLFSNVYTSLVTYTRNQIVRNYPGTHNIETSNTIPFGNKVRSKKIIFIDDDIVWTIEDLKKILESDKDIVSGFYKMLWYNENGEFKITGGKKDDWMIESDIKNKTELIELESIGFGFVAIKFEVFEKIKFPWFETFDYINEKGIVTNISEDCTFAKKAIDAGYKIYGDPTVKLGHEKTIILTFNE